MTPSIQTRLCSLVGALHRSCAAAAWTTVLLGATTAFLPSGHFVCTTFTSFWSLNSHYHMLTAVHCSPSGIILWRFDCSQESWTSSVVNTVMCGPFCREMEPWEVSDGALWLLKELAAPFPDLVCEKLPEASELASLRHFDRCHKLHETLWTTLPGIGQGVGKRQFKPYLELFLPYVFKDLRCGNQLCEAAAGCCIAFFRDWLGQSIFSGRLDDLQMREMQNCSKIPARVHIPNAEPCKSMLPFAHFWSRTCRRLYLYELVLVHMAFIPRERSASHVMHWCYRSSTFGLQIHRNDVMAILVCR